jgi:predicted dehydrogenase
MIKAGLIGLGKMGISHCAIVNAHPEVDLVTICDTSSLLLEAFKKYSEIKCYSDYIQMLEKENLDCVFIATPTKYHFPIVKECLERNMHVFCEKPFTLTLEEGKTLTDLAKVRKLVNQVGYHNHFIGTFRELKRLIGKGILGNIYHFTGEAYGPVVTKEKSGTWRNNRAEGGGCLYDYASHVINLIVEILGQPVAVAGTQLKSVYSKGVEDTVYSMLTLENNIQGLLSVNWSDETYRKMSTSLTVFGKKGKIICDATELKIYLKEEPKDEKLSKGWNIFYITDLAIPVNFYLRGEEYSAQIDHFIDRILGKVPDQINPFESAYKTDKVIDLILNDANQN